MAYITLRSLDGADRGRTYREIPTPISIGREEGNTIQLNDERVSRFHLKIQEDRDRIILTDLESTNGTKVNGDDIRLRMLRPGDVITVGRSVLLFGTEAEIAARLAELRKHESVNKVSPPFDTGDLSSDSALDFELNWQAHADAQATLHSRTPPELPEALSPGQAAQVSELLEYFHQRVRELLASVSGSEESDKVVLDLRQWQNLVDLQAKLADYMRRIAEPYEDL